MSVTPLMIASAAGQRSVAEYLLERLKALVGASTEEAAAAAQEAVPQSGQTVSIHLASVRAEDGRTCTVRAVTRPHFGLGGGVVSTATPAAGAVRLLARGSITAHGAHPPERCIDAEEMFDELRARGCAFDTCLS